MKRRLGKMELRAANAMREAQDRGSLDFTMFWNRSNTWGLCPSIYYHGEKAAHASGCGYDKESACLVDFLSSLSPEKIRGHGCGFSVVRQQLQEIGWKLECIFQGKFEHGYRITRIEAAKPA